MKAVLLETIKKLTIIERDQPSLSGPNEVLIKVQQVGICGSEIHAFDGTHPYRKPPSILGHEMLGTVERVGSAVEGPQPGDRVTVDPQWPCGQCRWCESGDHHLCVAKQVLGTPDWPGALAEYIVAPADSVYAIPAQFSVDQAVTVEPLAVAVHTNKRARVTDGESVLILGAGSIGLLTAAVARTRGAAPIIVADVQQHCLDTGTRMAASHTILVGKESIQDRVRAICGPDGVDVVFLTVGAGELFNDAFAVVKRKGRIVVVALYKKPVMINPYNIIKKDLDVLGTIMSTDVDVREGIAMIVSGKVKAGHIVTHHLPIDEAQRGFELASTKADGAIKVVLDIE